jgi:hypothetical protein
MDKMCLRCKEYKSLEDFSKNTLKKDGVHCYCKQCANLINRESYKRNKQSFITRSEKWCKKRREENRLFLWEYKEMHPCVDCGESDPRVLQFDHVVGDKIADVTELAYSKRSPIEVIVAEIEKCVVRCANCHLRRTWDSRGYIVPKSNKGNI